MKADIIDTKERRKGGKGGEGRGKERGEGRRKGGKGRGKEGGEGDDHSPYSLTHFPSLFFLLHMTTRELLVLQKRVDY